MKEKYIALLTSQPSLDSNLNLSKINIHLPIRGEMQKYCIGLNQRIRTITETEIDLGPSSFKIPHLSLYMGFVDTETNFNRILEVLFDYSETLEPFFVSSASAYLKEPDKNYVFLGIDQIYEINVLKQEIRDRINKHIIPLDWDIMQEVPHITLGYINSNFVEVSNLLENHPRGPSWMADALEISFCGERGSCLGTIKAFELTGQKTESK